MPILRTNRYIAKCDRCGEYSKEIFSVYKDIKPTLSERGWIFTDLFTFCPNCVHDNIVQKIIKDNN